MVKQGKMFGVIAGLALGATFTGHALAGVILSDLIAQNGSIQVGDKLFDQFSYVATDTNQQASAITVDSFTVTGNYGLTFAGVLGNATSSSKPNSTTTISYRVTVVDPSESIVSAYLFGNLSASPIAGSTSSVSVSESFTEVSDLLSIASVYSGGTKAVLTSPSYSALTAPVTSLHVVDTITASASGYRGLASISLLSQAFGQVPEPSTLSFLGLAAGSLLIRRRGNH